MENDEVSQVMNACSSVASTCTAASGRFFTISENSLPGTTVRPSSSTRAATEYWMESSRSVACRIIWSPVASMRMPESTGSVERVETPFNTMESALASSVRLMLSFTMENLSLAACRINRPAADTSQTKCRYYTATPAHGVLNPQVLRRNRPRNPSLTFTGCTLFHFP